MRLAPIALFAYNRPSHLRRTLDALRKNELAAESELFVFSDGPKSEQERSKVEEVREYLREVNGFKAVRITKQSANLGLARSIVNGVTEICHQHGRVIVMEDDLVTSRFFLRYMNGALTLYENSPEVISVHGYIYPILQQLPETFFIRGADCWGWATWRRGWDLFESNGSILLEELQLRGLTKSFDFDGNMAYTEMLRQQIAGANSSWAIRWYATAFLRGKVTLYPGRSLVQNIGVDGSGQHCSPTEAYQVPLATEPIELIPLAPVENTSARHLIEAFFSTTQLAPVPRRGPFFKWGRRSLRSD